MSVSSITVIQALECIMKESSPTMEKCSMTVNEAHGRIIAENITIKVPTEDMRTMLKGYAVITADGMNHRRIIKTPEDEKELSKLILKLGEAMFLKSGDPLPIGADAIIPEAETSCTLINDEEFELCLYHEPKKEQHIMHSSGIALRVVIQRCDRIRAPHLCFLSTIGKTSVAVYKRPSVGIISTQSNTINEKMTLISIFKEQKCNSRDEGHCDDNIETFTKLFNKAVQCNEIIVVLENTNSDNFSNIIKLIQKNAIIHFNSVNMKLGDRITFASLKFENKMKLIFLLSSDVVEAAIHCLLFVVPALKLIERCKFWKLPVVKAYMEGRTNNTNHFEYVMVSVQYDGEKLVAYPKHSHLINELITSNGLLVLPPKVMDKSNNYYETYIFDEFN